MQQWWDDWVFLGPAAETRRPGDYVRRDVAFVPLIVSRGSGGELCVLRNWCTHRGNMVCLHRQGNGRVFRCTYHGWSFSSDGRAVGITQPSGYPADFDQSMFDLVRPPRVVEHHGLIFASMNPDVGPPPAVGPLSASELGLAGPSSIGDVIGVHLDAAADEVFASMSEACGAERVIAPNAVVGEGWLGCLSPTGPHSCELLQWVTRRPAVDDRWLGPGGSRMVEFSERLLGRDRTGESVRS